MSAKRWLFVLISEHIKSDLCITVMSALRFDNDDIYFSFCVEFEDVSHLHKLDFLLLCIEKIPSEMEVAPRYNC